MLPKYRRVCIIPPVPLNSLFNSAHRYFKNPGFLPFVVILKGNFMKKSFIRIAAAAGMVLSTAGLSEAHTYGAQGAGFLQGALHPLGGADHVLAMVAVGLWAGLMGGRAKWAFPLAFVAMMVAGGLSGAVGMIPPGAETVIALSVLILGGAVALKIKWPVAAGAGLVGLFALFHGFVHGAEVGQAASWLTYPLGFVLATSLLHMAGILAATRLEDKGKRFGGYVRLSGGAIAAVGIFLLIGA
jgi:urease accessory protein